MTVAGLPGTARVVEAVRAWQTEHSGPLVVAIDGHGGSGKTTLAGDLAAALGAVVLHTDDYFRDAGVGGAGADRRAMARYYDWERMREQAILPALVGGDVAAAVVVAVAASAAAAAIPGGLGAAPVLIEGVSSASPALADLVTHSVLVVTPEPVRLARLHGRVSEEEWDEEWLAEERVYFGQLPPESFDLVVAGGG